jgi:tetratricopeptide (TPR) repeat protein
MKMRNAECGMRNEKTVHRKPILIFFLALMVATSRGAPAFAEVKVIDADSSYIMGDNDSKVDARRIAIQEAKRKALELAGTYVESLTQVKNYQLTKDEVKSYAAGVLDTEVVSEQMRGTTEHPEIYVKTRCKIDTDVLMAQIDKYRENEDLKEQLDASSKENEDIRKERDALVKQLAAEKNKTKAAETRQKLDTVLAKAEANDETHTVWINIGPQLVQVDENNKQIKQADLDRSSVILQRAIKNNPQNLRSRLMLAAIYEKKGNTAAAEAELRAAVQHNPSDPASRMGLGVLLRKERKYEGALQQFHLVEKIRPRNPMMLFYSGMTFKDMGKCGRAVQYLHRFLKDPRSGKFPKKKEQAVQTINSCGGVQGEHPRRGRNR